MKTIQKQLILFLISFILTSFQIFSQIITITSFTPTEGIQGQTITITGTNFTGTTVVSFGSTDATSFNVVSETTIVAVVGSGTSGDVSVTTPLGTATKSGFMFGIIPDSYKPTNVYSNSFTWEGGVTTVSDVFNQYPRMFKISEQIDPKGIYIVDAEIQAFRSFPGSKGISFGIFQEPRQNKIHNIGEQPFEWGYYISGYKMHDFVLSTYGDPYSPGDVVRLQYDASAGTISYFLLTSGSTTDEFVAQSASPAFSNVSADAGKILTMGLSFQCLGSCVINLKDANLPEIQLTGASTDFGNTDINATTSDKTFTINNAGTATLIFSGTPFVSISGTDASDFTVTTQPPATISGNSSSDFIIAFNPSTTGTKTATVTITSNDLDEGTYTFDIQGTVVSSNTAPTASNVAFTGTLEAGQTLTGSYTYADVDNDIESGSTYKWYRSDDGSGTNKAAISGAIATTYTLTTADAHKQISFEVTPNDGTAAGTAVESALQVVLNTTPTFTSTPITSIDENQTYTYSITTNDVDNDAVTLTAPTVPSWLSLNTNYEVSTLAGSGTLGFVDGTGTAAQFYSPFAVAVDASGNVYVADSNNNRIRKITPSGVVTTLAGSGTAGFADGAGTAARFNAPKGVAVDALGNVYVADLNNNKIRKITAAGVVTTLAGSSFGYTDGTGTAAQFANPRGVAVDASGNVYVADTNNDKIRKITDAGVVTTLAGSGFGYTDSTGTAAQFATPSGVAVDASGNVYVADTNNDKIRKITPSGFVTTLAGSTQGFADGTGTAAQFTNPYGVSVDASGNVYVADLFNHKIRKITTSGVVTTLAGSTLGFADGTGTAAQFSSPYGVAVDTSDNLYVADTGNHRIRKITQSSVLTGDTTGQVGSHSVVLNASDGQGGSTNQSFTITVNDITAPTLSSLVPADDATGVLIGSNLVLTFSENVQKGTGNILIKDAADNSTVQTIDVTSNAVSITNTVVTINPPTDLLKSKNYYIQIPATAFTDTSLNAYTGITDMTTWNFATEQKIDPTITFTDITKTYGDADFNLGATSNATGTISYSIVAGGTGTATLSGTNNQTVTLGNAGTVTLRATQASDANYKAATKDITLTINTKPITVTADAKSKVYGDADPTLTYQITTGSLVGTDALTGTLSRATGEDVGTYAISSTLANSNYNITFVSADFTITQKPITVTADAKSKVYGDTDPTLTYQITTGALVGSDALSGGLTRVTGENVGTYAISSTLANTNYVITYVSADLTITAKPITITADAKSKVYGDTDPTLTYQITTGSLLGTDALTGTLARATGENAGTYAISSTLANTNYVITYVSADLTITAKPITITPDAKSKVYGDTDPTLTYQITTGALLGTDTLTGTLARASGESVGTYAISSTLANSNYNITYVSADLTISAKALTITADTKSKVYGDTDPTLTYQITTGALVGSDTLSGGLTRTTGENVGTYAISSTLTNTNYSITYVSADLTITAKALTITADAKTKVYGDADPSLTYQITTGTLVGADALSGTLTRATGENVGTYTISSTLANTNYTITYVSADVTISAKPITVKGDTHVKVYGDPDPEFTYQLTSGTLESGDTFTGLLTREVTAFSEFPNTYTITQGTLTAGSNYDLTYNNGGIQIIPAAVVSTTQSATSITTSDAVLNGTIYEGGDYTNIFFEYGLASDLTGATSTAGSPALIQPGSGTTPVSLTITTLSDNTIYYYRITGTNGVGTVNGAIMSFTTLDGTPPAIVSTIPADNTTGVTSSNLQIVFNEDVQKGTGDILIKRTSDNQVVATIPVNGSEVTIDNTAPKATAVEGTVTINISPTLTLPSNTDLYIEIPSGAFTDTSGNAFAGISTNTLWNFSTDTVLGLNTNFIKGFTLYPNPVIDVLNISAQENLKTIQVFNLMGQQVFQKSLNSNKGTINLNRLPQGTYFVKVTTDKTAKAVKLIKR